jgi:rod shape-determining protein MreC
VIHRRTLSLLVILCLGHVLLISAQVQAPGGLPVIEAVSFGVFSRLQAAIAGTADGVGGIWEHYLALRGASEENEVLRRRILDLEGELQGQRALARRATSLEDALGLRPRVAEPTLAVSVVSGSPSPVSLTVLVDRGSADGLKPDMAVIGAEGVIGRVVEPLGPNTATVQLLIDRLAAVAVTFELSNAGAIVYGGAGDPPLRAEHLPALTSVQVGERVVTSGIGGIYPAGYLVGTVAEVARTAGPEREILIRPAVDFSHLDVVLVVLKSPQLPGTAE